MSALIFGPSELPIYGILLAAIGFAFSFAFRRPARFIASLCGLAILMIWF
jgi:hypothetical protein